MPPTLRLTVWKSGEGWSMKLTDPMQGVHRFGVSSDQEVLAKIAESAGNAITDGCAFKLYVWAQEERENGRD